jgi:hypothetical protein
MVGDLTPHIVSRDQNPPPKKPITIYNMRHLTRPAPIGAALSAGEGRYMTSSWGIAASDTVAVGRPQCQEGLRQIHAISQDR